MPPILWCWYDPATDEIFHTSCLLKRLTEAGWADADYAPDIAAERRDIDRVADLVGERIDAGLLREEDAPRHLDHGPDEALTVVARNGFRCAACGVPDGVDPLE